jgi:hypothetical protein
MMTAIFLESCPQCERALRNPLKLSGCQICSGCGWRSHQKKDERISLSSQEPSTAINLDNEIHLLNKLDSPRKAYQFIQIRVQLVGRGMTQEIMNLYVNGKRLRPSQKTLPDFLNYLGFSGFKVVTAVLETEGVYTHFITLQREVFTHELPPEDIFDTLGKTKEGADFGDSVRNIFEFTLGDNI